MSIRRNETGPARLSLRYRLPQTDIPTVTGRNHIARFERISQKSPVLRARPQKNPSKFLPPYGQNYFVEKLSNQFWCRENPNDSFESANELVYVSRWFLVRASVSRPATRRRGFGNRCVEWSDSAVKTDPIARSKWQQTCAKKRGQRFSMQRIVPFPQRRFCLSDHFCIDQDWLLSCCKPVDSIQIRF